ncbi:MAG: cupin domain-containing protein [Myxococcota bacterium]
MDDEVERWIRDLGLEPHPEGGYYRETSRTQRCTTIVYLLRAGQVSAWHRVRDADETWHHYGGDPLALHQLDADGLRTVTLGAGTFHAVVPADTWQAATPVGARYSLVGCTVAPPFEFARFELADPVRLAAEFPAWSAAIRAVR